MQFYKHFRSFMRGSCDFPINKCEIVINLVNKAAEIELSVVIAPETFKSRKIGA